MDNTFNLPTFSNDAFDESIEEVQVLTPADLEELAPLSSEELEAQKNKDANPDITRDPTADGVYNTLVEKGLFEKSEDFDGTFDTLEKYFNDIPTKTREAILNEAPDTGKEIIDYIISGGNSLTNENILDFVSKYLDANTKTQDLNLDSAVEILTNNFKELGFDEDQIEINLELLKDKGDDVVLERANKIIEKSKPNLNQEIEQVRLDRIEEEKQQREYTESIITTINESEYSATRKKEITNAIKSDRVTEVLVEAVSNPKTLIQLANLVLSYNKDKGFDLKEFAKQVASKDIKELKDSSFKDNFNSVPTTSSYANPKRDLSKLEFEQP